jgi:signal transduction histidine kinase
MGLMFFKQYLDQLNIFAQCKRYELPLWQCPQFLFVVMGIAIAIISVVVYLLGTRYIVDSAIAGLITLFLTAFLLIMNFIIIRGLENMAEANRLKSEFISIVSHQLRSPLTNLKWSAELLLSGKLGEIGGEQLEYFKILTENTERMTELVSDLLIVARINRGSLVFKKTEFSLIKLAEEIMAKYKTYAAATNIKVNLKIEGSPSPIIADPSQVKSVIENLLDNAVRYTKGGGEINIKIAEKERNLVFEIEDNGVGIPQPDQKHIFQKFFRSINILKYQTQGSGLGLYIAKSIIEKSGGKIGFSSQEGKGSIFWFRLPIK